MYFQQREYQQSLQPFIQYQDKFLRSELHVFIFGRRNALFISLSHTTSKEITHFVGEFSKSKMERHSVRFFKFTDRNFKKTGNSLSWRPA